MKSEKKSSNFFFENDFRSEIFFRFRFFFSKFIQRFRRIDLNRFRSVSDNINPPIPGYYKILEKIYGFGSHLRSDNDVLIVPERSEGLLFHRAVHFHHW